MKHRKCKNTEIFRKHQAYGCQLYNLFPTGMFQELPQLLGNRSNQNTKYFEKIKLYLPAKKPTQPNPLFHPNLPFLPTVY